MKNKIEETFDKITPTVTMVPVILTPMPMIQPPFPFSHFSISYVKANVPTSTLYEFRSVATLTTYHNLRFSVTKTLCCNAPLIFLISSYCRYKLVINPTFSRVGHKCYIHLQPLFIEGVTHA